MQLVIYPKINGTGITLLTPVPGLELSIGEMAIKDVPSGVPYRIIDSSQVPTDRTFRDAWEADFTNPDGYGIGHEQWFDIKSELYE
jgi:hypothetical protein